MTHARTVADPLDERLAGILDARQRQVALRNQRIEQLTQLLGYLRIRLSAFLTRTDPVGGARLLDVGADETRAQGGFAVIVAAFDGSRLKIAVDSLGRYSFASLPEALGEVGRILDVRVAADFGSAEYDFIPAGHATETRTGNVDELVLALLERAALTVEGEGGNP